MMQAVSSNNLLNDHVLGLTGELLCVHAPNALLDSRCITGINLWFMQHFITE